MEILLELQNITKRYGRRTVLSDVSLALPAGRCYALTGANGCGKSTLLRIAAGVSVPGAGRVCCPGGGRQYVPDQFPRLNIAPRALFRALEGVDCADMAAVARAFGLEAALDQPIRGFSKGMLSKLGVLQALCARPRVLLLDEPLSGQDAAARRVFSERVRQLMDGGTAVLMACHERELIERLADRVFVLRNGALLEGDATISPQRTVEPAQTPGGALADRCADCLCAGCAARARGDCPGRAQPDAAPRARGGVTP